MYDLENWYAKSFGFQDILYTLNNLLLLKDKLDYDKVKIEYFCYYQ